MDSETIHGSVDTDVTVIPKIFNKNQWCYRWRGQNNEAILKLFDPILIIWVNLQSC